VVEALRELGDVELDLVPDVSACLKLASQVPLDLVVADAAEPGRIAALRDGLGTDGPPVVAVTPGGREEERRAARMAGAAEAVAFGGGFAAELAGVAAERLREVSQRRELLAATRRVRELQQYHENFLQSLNIALVELDADGVIRHANETAGALLGRFLEPARGLRGRRLWDWFPEQEQGPVGDCLREGRKCQGVESECKRPEASPLPIGITCSPLHDEQGVQVGAVATLQDLTEVRQLQERTQQSEKMASLGVLVAGVAHEINNPMAIVSTNLSAMATDVAGLGGVWEQVGALREAVEAEQWTSAAVTAELLSEKARDVDMEYVLSDLPTAIDESREAAERIRNIVNDLGDFARPDAGHHDWANLNDCVESTANIAWTMMKQAVVLEKDYAELPPLLCSSLQLKQVVMNLLVNAYQSIEEKRGGTGPRGRIVLRTREAGGGVEFVIEDDGVGIAEENLKKIFDPYFTTKPPGQGLGVGLAMSLAIVHRHRGWIQPVATPGGGASFRVWLPLEGAGDEASPEGTHAGAGEDVPTGGTRDEAALEVA